MKIEIKTKVTVIGYHKLAGVERNRIKARGKKKQTGIKTTDIDSIIKEKGEYVSEYRLVKEPKGFIFREVLCDCGINGHWPTQREAIYRTAGHVDIFIDESFEHENMPDFPKYKKIHFNRENGCKHKNQFLNRWGNYECPDCQLLPD